jgi:hypothetical protein
VSASEGRGEKEKAEDEKNFMVFLLKLARKLLFLSKL